MYALGLWYNYAYVGVEANKDGLWVNDSLLKNGYNNLYFREQFDDIAKTMSRKVGFRTDERTRPYILSELRDVLSKEKGIWVDKEFLEQCLVFVRNKVGRPEAMPSKHDDRIIAEAIALEIRRNAPQAFQALAPVPQTNEQIVLMRLEKLKKSKYGGSEISQDRYI